MNAPDIERLRESRERLYVYGGKVATQAADDGIGADLDRVLAAAHFLVSMADQGGELWRERKCEHGVPRPHYFGSPGPCYGGSRVRVWPKSVMHPTQEASY